jgi:hypothetical protein
MMASQQAMVFQHQALQSPGKDCPCRGSGCSASHNESAIPVAAPVSFTDSVASSLDTTPTFLPEDSGVTSLSDCRLPSAPYLLSLDPPPKSSL